ncbi:hypothetical protein ACFLX0_02215 [Chloroflexota bacterium]
MRQQTSRNGRFSGMLIPTIIMGVLAITLTVISYNKGGGEHIVGLKIAGIIANRFFSGVSLT